MLGGTAYLGFAGASRHAKDAEDTTFSHHSPDTRSSRLDLDGVVAASPGGDPAACSSACPGGGLGGGLGGGIGGSWSTGNKKHTGEIDVRDDRPWGSPELRGRGRERVRAGKAGRGADGPISGADPGVGV